MIHRETNAETVNALIGRDFPGVDYSEVLSEPLHVCLVDDDSGAIFAWRGPGTYEVHVFFAVRGREAINLGHAMLDYMRDNHAARKFWALVPVGSEHVKVFTRLMGWASQGVLKTRHGDNELFTQETDPCHP